MSQPRREFTCYFCNKTIRDDSEMGHTSVCGNVLVPCPNKCGSYVPRMDMLKHKKECVNRVGKSMPRLTSIGDYPERYDNAPDTASLDRKDPPNKAFRDLFGKLQDDLRKLSSRLAYCEQNTFRDGNNFGMNQQFEVYKNAQLQQRQDVERLKYQQQSVMDWRNAISLQLETLKQAFNSCEVAGNERDMQWMSFQQKIMALDQLRLDLNLYRESFLKEQSYSRQADLEFAKKLDEFRDLFDQENATVGALWSEQKTLLEQLQSEIVEIRKAVAEQKTKHANVAFDFKAVSQIAAEAADNIEIQQRDFRELKKEVRQMKLDLEILEDLASSSSNFGTPTSTPGHIIWKISDFDSKLTKAKESNSVVKSQIFFTHDFGYRIRILVHLNGLKKWKDRYALISIHVLKGEFDGLLKWPCHIEGTVTLRDLEDLDDPKHFCKFISAKREAGDEDNEEPQESSSSYIFIPHGTLTKSKYLKDDTVYLEVKINPSRNLRTETTL